MVDACVGRLVATLERLGLFDDTAIFFTSDHGAYFDLTGDQGLVGKPDKIGADGMTMSAGRPPAAPVRDIPQRTGVVRLPLLLRLPGQSRGRRLSHIVQPWDLTPTILDLFSQPAPSGFRGPDGAFRVVAVPQTQ